MRRRRSFVLAAIAGILGIVVYAVAVEPRLAVTRRTRVGCAGLDAPVSLLVFSDVDYPRAAACRAALRRAAEADRPDLILVPGDFIDRDRTFSDPALVRAGGAEIAALPAGTGRILAPGEAESAQLEALRRSFHGLPVTIGENERFPVEVRGQSIDLFVADLLTDPVPWGVGRIEGRPGVVAGSRSVNSSIVYDGSGAASWSDVEITLAFRLDRADSYIDLRLGWHPGPDPAGDTGWRILRHEYHPTIRLLPRFEGEHRLSGRTESAYEPEPGLWHRARIVMHDDGTATRIRARFWPERGVEPAFWTIDAKDEGPGRRHSGSIAFGARFGGRAIADLRVSGPGGRELLNEPFDDAPRFRREWRQPSRLAAWAFSPRTAPRILLAHDPDIVLDLATMGAPPPDLVIAGHTHGGQIRLPFLPPFYTATRLPRRFASGLHRWRGIPFYVTPGLGTSVLPARFLVPPEITRIELVPTGPMSAR
jgi:predicted MPP superfamily phosphohydrolase